MNSSSGQCGFTGSGIKVDLLMQNFGGKLRPLRVSKSTLVYVGQEYGPVSIYLSILAIIEKQGEWGVNVDLCMGYCK